MKSFYNKLKAEFYFLSNLKDKFTTILMSKTSNKKVEVKKSFYKKIQENLFGTDINSSFDTFNIESLNITNPSTFSGVKTEISKTISRNFQISHISNKSSDFDSRQTFGTFCFNNLLFQTSIDQDKNYRIRGTHMFNNLFTKFHTVIGQSKEIFTQVELDLKNRINNMCFKMIQPAIKGASCIYIGNYMQQLGMLSLGGEIIKADEYLGLTLVGRYDGKKSISTISLQHFNTLSFDYFKKLSTLVDYGLRFSTNRQRDISYGLGLKIHSTKGEIIGSIDNNKTINVCYNDKLSEGLSLNLSCKIGKNIFEYGYGFIYEF